MHIWLPKLVANFWLPNLVLYQTDEYRTYKGDLFSQNKIEQNKLRSYHAVYLLILHAGLCRGCVLGTLSTLKSGMSPNILADGANVPTYFRFMNGNITEVTPEKLQMSPYFSMVWVICCHFCKALAEHCVWHLFQTATVQTSCRVIPCLLPPACAQQTLHF